MTTKYRIIIGFTLILAILSAISWIGYAGSSTAYTRSQEFDRLSKFNAALGDMTTALYKAAYYITRYVDGGDSNAVDQARQGIDEFGKTITLSLESVSLPERKAKLAELEEIKRRYTTNLDKIKQETDLFDSINKDKITPAARLMASSIDTMAKIAKDFGNVEASYGINIVLLRMSSTRASFSRYLENRKTEVGERTEKLMEDLGKSIQDVGKTLIAEVSIEKHKELSAAFDTYSDALRLARNSINSVNSAIELQSVDRYKALDIAIKLSAELDAQARAYAADTLNALDSTKNSMFFTGSGGILLGIACALIITMLLGKTLARLASFSREIAKGNFTAVLGINEKGEVGEVSTAIYGITDTLKQMSFEYHGLEKSIETGRLDAQADTSKFSGEFAELMRGTNNILKRMELIFNSISSPIVVLDKDQKASFINRAARDLAGTDYLGKTCKQLFNRDDSGSATCALTKAVSGGTTASSETVAHPRGNRMDIRYTATPLFDASGKLASILQLIIDLTQVKDTERRIMKVAGEAGVIADRVATASEQLATQVEQVSRGAEVQRTRMESTVSAMTEMNSTVIEVARNAGEASDQSENTRKKANDGANLVNKVVSSINTVNNVAVNLQNNMQELGNQAESIGGVMNVISDIADQTNLLALNAAIEAARAGEAGRGFAVVADEVRKLAEKTMTATKEVGDSINAIQNSANTNIDEVSKAVKSISEATDLANSSGSALREIVDLAEANSGIVSSIATAAEEQSATSEEINRALDEVNRVVGETADGMVQASSAVQDLSGVAQQLKQVMAGLR